MISRSMLVLGLLTGSLAALASTVALALVAGIITGLIGNPNLSGGRAPTVLGVLLVCAAVLSATSVMAVARHARMPATAVEPSIVEPSRVVPAPSPELSPLVQPVDPVGSGVGARAEEDEALGNWPWVHLLEECVALYEELDLLSDRLDEPRREMAVHVTDRVKEILGRQSSVSLIEDEPEFDSHRHKAVRGAPHPGDQVLETISSGVAVGRRVLLRARVRVADPVPTRGDTRL